MKKYFTFFLLFLIVCTNFSCSFDKVTYKFKKTNIKVALVLPGPANDPFWNKATYDGLKRFTKDYHVNILVVEKVSLADANDVFSELGERKTDLVIGNGYGYGYILKRIAKKYPDTFFCTIGGEVSQEPNLCSFGFKDEQYGFLVGSIAGLNTTTNKVGIVVGEKLPSIERIILGMREGLKSVNPKADLVVSYINSWNDISKGREAALTQINTGVDVITHIADVGGIGVIKAAEEADISAIGAITDQHDLAPGAVITSSIEDASQLVYLVCEYYVERGLKPKAYHFGLKDQVIDLAPSYGNIDPTIETRINRIRDQLTDLEAAQEEEQKTRRKKD